MISELMNKQFLVIDEKDIANIKSNDQSKGSPNHSRSNSLAIPTSPPSLIPLSTSPGSPSRFSGHRRGSSLSKGQLEIRKVYEKISNSPIFNVQDKVLEKNQKAIQLSNDESLLALYFNDWLEVMEEQSDSHHHNSHGKPLVKKKDHFHVKFTMYDMDDYPFYFPLNLLDDGRLHDDFVKFGVTFFIPSIKEKERTFMFLEDGLVHLLERSDFELSSEGVSHYKSESFVIRENSDRCKILKKLKKICKVIQDFNIDKTFHMNKKGGSFFFCRKIAKIFSEEGNLKSSLSDNIKKLFKLWKERADKKMEDEEHLDDFYHDPFYCKNEYVPMDDLSKLMKKATQTDAEKIKSSAIHPSAYEIIFEKIMISSSMMATGNKDTFPLFEFHLPKKGHFSFETYSQFNEFLYEHFGNEEGLERMKKHHHMDYLYLKILDRKLWCCKIATGLFDPLISKPYLFNIGARKPFFSIPISLKEYFGNAEAIQIDYTQLKESKKGQTVKVLCLDGGGMRGLCIIEQLIAMEQKTGKKINELFDMVSGTSTGGIIAFFIEAGYSMEEVKAKYMLMGRDIFNIKSKFANMKKAFNFIRGKSWYETKIIEKYFRQESGRMDLYSATNTRPFVFVCGTIKPEKVKEPGSIVSSKFVEQFPYIFRTYPDPFISTKELSDKLLDPYLDFLPKNEYDDVFYAGTRTGRGVKVVDSLRATTSAPIFFDPVCIGNDHFTDGGIVANNPSAIALNEVMRMYMGHNNFLFVSLGTGKKRRKVFDSESIDLSSSTSSKKGSSFSSSSMDNITERSFIENLIITASDLKLLIDLVISSERIHAQMLTTVKLLNERDCNANISYYRFDPEDLGQYDLDCILPEVIEKYEKTTREYILSQPDFDVVCKRLLDP